MAAQSGKSVLPKVLGILGGLVAGIAIIYILFVFPQLQKMRKSVNENSAIQSIRTISQAELSYESMYPAQGFACSLPELSGPPASLIPPELGSGLKAGYVFAVLCGSKETLNNQDRYTSFEITAVPSIAGKTGDRGFCMDQDNNLKYDPDGGTNCTKPVE